MNALADGKGLWLALALVSLSCATTPNVPESVTVYRDPRPTLKWSFQKGRTYNLLCKTVPRKGERAVTVASRDIQGDGKWTFETPLEFDRHYRCEVKDEEDRSTVFKQTLVVQFEPADLYSPSENQIVRNMRPRFRWKPAQNTAVRYQVLLGDDVQLARRREAFVEGSAVQRYPGEDNQFNTDDDIVFVEWVPPRDLETGKAYFWAVRTLFFPPEAIAGGKRPPPEARIGMVTSVVRSFTVPSQTQLSESLAGVTRVTERRPNSDPREPTVSKKFAVAYTLVETTDGGVDPFYVRRDKGSTSIHVVAGQLRGGSPVFDRGDEQFTQAVRGSLDSGPAWDHTGEGLYFSSNRAHIHAIWHKSRAGRGYELLSNHDRPARSPSVSDDGRTIVYVLARRSAEEMDKISPEQIEAKKSELFTIWKMDSDGRAPTDLGPGYDPAISHDGARVAFVRKDSMGCDQVAIMNLEGGGGVMFLTNEGRNYHPRWSPDDRRIVFVSERDIPGRSCFQSVQETNPNPDIWIINADGTRPTRITDYIGDDLDPTFTPDGNHVIFTSTRDSSVVRETDGVLLGSQFSLWMGRLGSVE